MHIARQTDVLPDPVKAVSGPTAGMSYSSSCRTTSLVTVGPARSISAAAACNRLLQVIQ